MKVFSIVYCASDMLVSLTCVDLFGCFNIITQAHAQSYSSEQFAKPYKFSNISRQHIPLNEIIYTSIFALQTCFLWSSVSSNRFISDLFSHTYFSLTIPTSTRLQSWLLVFFLNWPDITTKEQKSIEDPFHRYRVLSAVWWITGSSFIMWSCRFHCGAVIKM